MAPEWEEIPIPSDFERKPFSPGLAARHVSVHASLLGSGEICGQIVPGAGVIGLWMLKLERLGNVLADLSVHVDGRRGHPLDKGWPTFEILGLEIKVKSTRSRAHVGREAPTHGVKTG